MAANDHKNVGHKKAGEQQKLEESNKVLRDKLFECEKSYTLETVTLQAANTRLRGELSDKYAKMEALCLTMLNKVKACQEISYDATLDALNTIR